MIKRLPKKVFNTLLISLHNEFQPLLKFANPSGLLIKRLKIKF